MKTYYRWTKGPFEDTIVSDRGFQVAPTVFIKLHPMMAILDAAADEDGDAFVKGVGTRVVFNDQYAVRYDLFVD